MASDSVGCVAPRRSVTHEVSNRRSTDVDALVLQTRRWIPTHTTTRAADRGVPFEPHERLTDEYLQWEHDEISGFLTKQLRKDPRLKPENLVVDLDHLTSCQVCKQDDAHQASMHEQASIRVGTKTQLFVDDWVIESWQNAVRILNAPTEKRIALSPEREDDDHVRFGCPCSALPTDDGKVQLFYTDKSNTLWEFDDPEEAERCQPPDAPDDCQPIIQYGYSYRISANGATNWSPENHVQVEWNRFMGTFTAAGGPSLPRMGHSSSTSLSRVAGYEGRHGLVCIAYSMDDQQNYRTIASNGDREEGDDCYDNVDEGYESVFKRAGDTYIQPLIDNKRQTESIIYRKDFGTNGGWREIRGVQAVSTKLRMADIVSGETDERTEIVNSTSWYLDRLGKAERFRRQVYSMTLTPYNEDLWLGIVNVIEWAKDLNETKGPDQPYLERDMINPYLVTSRDGRHVDLGWVYAQRPLVPKDGLIQSDWASGIIFSSAQFMTRDEEHRMYFEARPGHIQHENRYRRNYANIGTAAWPRDRIVGIAAAHANLPAIVRTKPFAVEGGNLVIDVDTSCGNITVALHVISGFSGDQQRFSMQLRRESLVIKSRDGRVNVEWANAEGFMPLLLRDLLPSGQGIIQLQFHLNGGAKLYAFRMSELPSRPPRSLSPSTPPLPTPSLPPTIPVRLPAKFSSTSSPSVHQALSSSPPAISSGTFSLSSFFMGAAFTLAVLALVFIGPVVFKKSKSIFRAEQTRRKGMRLGTDADDSIEIGPKGWQHDAPVEVCRVPQQQDTYIVSSELD